MRKSDEHQLGDLGRLAQRPSLLGSVRAGREGGVRGDSKVSLLRGACSRDPSTE